MLGRVIERVRRASALALVLVATTTTHLTTRWKPMLRSRNYPVFRGEMYDVLDRFYHAALQSKADAIVRITADCSVIDPVILIFVVGELRRSGGGLRCEPLAAALEGGPFPLAWTWKPARSLRWSAPGRKPTRCSSGSMYAVFL